MKWLLLLISFNVYSDDLENYYRAMVYKRTFNGSEYISIKTNEDDKFVNYSYKPIEHANTIIIPKKEFERLMQDFR